MSLHPKRLRAFTLVELLVVIGIIAALIGILLPVLSGVQARGRDIKCQSNIRQILQAINGYAAENKGFLPYGFYFDPSINDAHPDAYNALNTWDPKNGTNRFVSWASQVGKYMVRKADGDNEDNNFPPVLNCPEAEMSFHHIVGYVANFVAFPSPWYDRQINSTSRWIGPPKTSGLFGHNALIWDTAVSPGLDNNVGYLTGADIDGQRFWRGAQTPQYRFYDPADVYGRIPPGIFGNNKPVTMAPSGQTWKNIDPPDPTGNGPGIPYQGNLRFRHAKETAVNVGFMDGHVEPIKGKFKSDRTLVNSTSHDALRKLFMIKWPAGIPRDTSVP